MRRISLQLDSPSYLNIGEISKELYDFVNILIKKYNSIDFEFAFCFRTLHSTKGIKSKVRFYKKENWLGMDLIMPESDFKPYKDSILMQRKIIGKYFFPFFVENIKKYRNKLSSLTLVSEDLIEDMRLFLIDNLWLENEEGKLKLTLIETVDFDKAICLFGKPTRKKFNQNKDGEKTQSLIWNIDKETKIFANYSLIDKKWILQNSKIE